MADKLKSARHSGSKVKIQPSAFETHLPVPANQIVDKLTILDSEIDVLINDKVNISNISSIQIYRGRIAKRIDLYNNHLRRLQHLYDTTPFGQDKLALSLVYYKHHENLNKYKRILSEWWTKVEKKFNQLCLASFISDNTANKPVVRHAKLEEKLSETKNMILSLDLQMQAAESNILKSSEYINEHEVYYQKFKDHLSKASSMLSSLHYRTTKRKNFIYTCFFFQLAMCTIVILRRLSIIRIVIWLISIIYKIIKLPIKLICFILGPLIGLNGNSAIDFSISVPPTPHSPVPMMAKSTEDSVNAITDNLAINTELPVPSVSTDTEGGNKYTEL